MLGFIRSFDSVGKVDSLEGERAAVQLLGSAKTSLLGRGTAEQQELVGGVHEFQLLDGERKRKGDAQRNNAKGKHYRSQTMQQWCDKGARRVSYPTERQLDDMRPVAGNDPAGREKDQTIKQIYVYTVNTGSKNAWIGYLRNHDKLKQLNKITCTSVIYCTPSHLLLRLYTMSPKWSRHIVFVGHILSTYHCSRGWARGSNLSICFLISRYEPWKKHIIENILPQAVFLRHQTHKWLKSDS